MKSEALIQNEIRIALSENDCTCFRANVGSVMTNHGIPFSTGLPKGHPDLYGFKHSNGKVFYIEVKNEKGKPRPDQIKFHEFLTKYNIIHGLARSAGDALNIVEREFVGYGYEN